MNVDKKIIEYFEKHENDIKPYLKTKFGERFFIINNDICKFIALYDKNILNIALMNNSRNEKIWNIEVVDKAKGNVLIAGLGMGMIILPIMNKPEVISVTIVELQKEIIELVGDRLPLNNKVKIIHSDIIDFKPDKKYDLIYFDTLEDFMLSKKEVEHRTKDGIFQHDRIMTKEFKKYLKEGGECIHYDPTRRVA